MIRYRKEKSGILLFREHRGSLSDSMFRMCRVNNLEDVKTLLNEEDEFILPIKDSKKLKCRYYGFDDRTQWDTWIVSLDDYGVVGFSNGELK